MTSFDETEKQIDIAVEAIKQQITLSTVVITASLAFSGFIKDVSNSLWDKLPWILIPLALTILFGILNLQSIAYYVKSTKNNIFSQGLVKGFGICQNLFFGLAILLMVIFISVAIFTFKPPPKQMEEPQSGVVYYKAKSPYSR